MAEAERRGEDEEGVKAEEKSGRIEYVSYKDETQLPDIMALIDQELSEPYSIFTYRYFITLWPDLCFMVSSLRTLSLTLPGCTLSMHSLGKLGSA
jgi:hypothetical protein